MPGQCRKPNPSRCHSCIPCGWKDPSSHRPGAGSNHVGTVPMCGARGREELKELREVAS